MHLEHLRLLSCPACHGDLTCAVGDADSQDGVITEGHLTCAACRHGYPVIAGVPRFVPRENYASGFGLEWTKHARTQYDSYSGSRLLSGDFSAKQAGRATCEAN